MEDKNESPKTENQGLKETLESGKETLTYQIPPKPKHYGIQFTATSYILSEDELIQEIEFALREYGISIGPISSTRRGVKGRRKIGE